MPPSHAKMRLKSTLLKLNYLMAKLYKKVVHYIMATNALENCLHSYGLLRRLVFEKKTILCGTNNIFYSLGNQK